MHPLSNLSPLIIKLAHKLSHSTLFRIRSIEHRLIYIKLLALLKCRIPWPILLSLPDLLILNIVQICKTDKLAPFLLGHDQPLLPVPPIPLVRILVNFNMIGIGCLIGPFDQLAGCPVEGEHVLSIFYLFLLVYCLVVLKV